MEGVRRDAVDGISREEKIARPAAWDSQKRLELPRVEW